MKSLGNINTTIQSPAKIRRDIYIQNCSETDFLDIHFTTANAMKMGDAKGYSMLFAGPSTFVGAQKCEDFVRFVRKTPFNATYDYYVTANTFRKPNIRQEENIFGLCNIVIDIDCHSSNKTVDELYAACEGLATFLSSEFKFYAEKHLMPGMNSIVITGRGVQLWWAFDPIRIEYADCYDALVDYFSNITDRFLRAHEQFQDFKLDIGASKNKTGLFRLPGTFNRKTGSLTKVIIVSRQIHSMFACRKKIRDMCENTQKIRMPNKVFRAAQTDDFAPIAFRRAISLEALVALRKGNLTGARDFILWMYHNECSKCMDQESAYHRMLAMNATFTEPLREKECQNIISGTLNIASTRAPKGYALRNETIINLLDISEQEQKTINLFPAEEKQKENARYFELIRYYDSKLRTRQKLLTQLAGLDFMRQGHSSVEAALVFGGGDRTWRTIRSNPESLYKRLQACENWIMQVESMIRDRSGRLLTVMQQAEVFYNMVAKKSNINLETYPFQITMPTLRFPQTIDGLTNTESALAADYENSAATNRVQHTSNSTNRIVENRANKPNIDSEKTINGEVRLFTEYRVHNSSEAGVICVPSKASPKKTVFNNAHPAAFALSGIDADARLAAIGALAAHAAASVSAFAPAADRPSELVQIEAVYPCFKYYPWTRVQTEALHILDAELFDIHHDNMFLFTDTRSDTDCFYDSLTHCLHAGRAAANRVLIEGQSLSLTLQQISNPCSFLSGKWQQDPESSKHRRENSNCARRRPTSTSSWEYLMKETEPFVSVWINPNTTKGDLPTRKQIGLVWHLLHAARDVGNAFSNLSIRNLTARKVNALIDFLRHVIKNPPCRDETRDFYDVNTVLSYFEKVAGFSGEAHFPYVSYKRHIPT